MLTIKQTVIEAVDRLPEDVSYKDVAEEIAFLAALREAEDAIEKKLVVSHNDVKARLELWTSN